MAGRRSRILFWQSTAPAPDALATVKSDAVNLNHKLPAAVYYALLLLPVNFTHALTFLYSASMKLCAAIFPCSLSIRPTAKLHFILL